MQMKQCKNGHFFDQSRNAECPYCTSVSANINVSKSPGITVPMKKTSYMEKTRSISAASAGDTERTQAVLKKDIGIDPVVGWLVCVEGKDRGRDYRIHSDNNFIGRSENMDICIRGDDTVSRENHAVISYDVRDRIFYFSPGEGRSIVRLNGKALFTTEIINAFDEIELGRTKLIFAPLCGEGFNWR